MKAAVFLKNNELTVLDEKRVQVVIFNIKNDKVKGVENITLEKQTNDSIVNWLYLKSIDQIHISEIDNQTYKAITSQGIKVKTLKNLENDKLYNTLALSSIQLKKTS